MWRLKITTLAIAVSFGMAVGCASSRSVVQNPKTVQSVEKLLEILSLWLTWPYEAEPKMFPANENP